MVSEAGRERRGWVEELLPPYGPRPGRLAFWWSEADGTASRVELTVIRADEGRARVRVLETRPLELLDLVATPLPGTSRERRFGPALLAGCR